MQIADDFLIGRYPYHIPENNDIIGLAYHAKSELMFASVGRFRPGVPSSLNAFCASDYEKGTSPHIWGFPNYHKNTLKASFYGEFSYNIRKLSSSTSEYSTGYYNYFFNTQNETVSSRRRISNNAQYYPNKLFNEFSIINVYHPTVDDRCNRLFVVDTGALHYGPDEIYEIQNPALIVFQLNSYRFRSSNGCGSRDYPVIRRVEIPQNLWRDRVGFAFISLDHQPKGTCEDIFVYITNVFDNSLTVYDFKHNTFWLIRDPSMNPVLGESKMVFNDNFHYDFVFGIKNIVLGWPDKNENRIAYFAPGASLGEYAVSTKFLRNPKKSLKGDFTLIGYRGCDSQTFKQAIDPDTGVIFFGEIQSRRIRCWNTHLPLSSDTIGLVYQSDALGFVSDIFLDADGYLWFHTSHLPIDFLTSIPLDLDRINSRTFCVKAADAIKNTVCDLSI